MTTTQQTRKPS